jgi:gluconolactonase
MIWARDLQNPEGPVALPDGTWLLVEGGADRGCVTHLSADGRTRKTIKKTGRPNGLAVGADGAIWVAESSTPSLLRLTMEGKCEMAASECDGEPFLFPNDLCFGSDGALYLTDSGASVHTFAPNNRIRPDYLTLNFDGRVYRIDPDTGNVELLDRGIRFTNGIAFGKDGLLYVNETITGNVYRYVLKSDGTCGNRKVFGNVIRANAPEGWVGPDGMAFDENGLLYVAVFGQGDVTVLGLDGGVVKRISTAGIMPTNVAFACAGERRLHVTEYEHGQMETLSADCDGLRLWDGRAAHAS